MKTACLILLFLFSFGGCQNSIRKQKELISQTVYATGDSIKAGRVDLADSYSEQAMKLVAPPKQRLQITPVYKTTKNIKEPIAVLPTHYGDKTSVVKDSIEFQKLVLENEHLKKQFEMEKKSMDILVKSVDATNKQLLEEIEKQKSEKKSLFSWIWGLIGGLGLLGTVVLIAFFPAALPIVMNIFGIVAGWIRMLLESIKNLFNKR